MMSLVDGLLELASLQSELERQYSPCNLHEIAANVVDEFQGQALAKSVKLTLDFAEAGGVVNGDAAQLRRALSNLVDNALKYSKEKCEVLVKGTAVSTNIVIAVHDQGPGIPESDLPFIFDKFYRGKDNSEIIGTGLGLALVKSIAEAHEGQVWAENKPDGGAVFFLQLPKAPEE
jgi:two-component system sensor histidine kinase KdpD